MRGRRCRVFVMALVLALPAGEALAQERGAVSVIASPESLERDINARRDMETICWVRGTPLTVDWVSSRDPGYRRDIFSQYYLEELSHGWRWYRDDGNAGREMRGEDAAQVEGLTESELEVHHGVEEGIGRAQLSVVGPLTTGKIDFEWTVPPERICMVDGLRLQAIATVAEGSPGWGRIMFVVPLTRDQIAEEGPDVKACSPNASTAVDSSIDYNRDEGECKRPLVQLAAADPWTVWVSLPESFYVVYPYQPDVGERSRRQ